MDEDLTYLAQLFDLPQTDMNGIPVLDLAYLGDAVYETVVRTVLVRRTGGRPKDLNRMAVRYVSAEAQSRMAEKLMAGLTEREREVYRRGRNASPQTMAKNASAADYHRATGFETLIGYLFLNGERARMLDLVRSAMEEQDKGSMEI